MVIEKNRSINGMLEITIGGTDRSVLVNSNLFNSDDVIDFCVLHSYGKIKGIENCDFRKISLAEFNPQEEFVKLQNKIQPYKEIRIWYSKTDSEDLNTFYFLINYLR